MRVGQADALIGRALRYLVVGGGVNAVLFGVFTVALALGALPEVASIGAFGLGIIATYVLNRGWSFASQRGHLSAAPRYVVVYLAGLCVQLAVLAGLHRGLDIHPLIAQLLAMGLAAVTIFAGLNFWVFKSGATATASRQDP